MMILIPILITIVVSILALNRYGEQIAVFLWSLMPMWICYAAITVYNIVHIF